MRTHRCAEHFEDLQQLVLLERHVFLRIQLRLLALEDRPQARELRHDAPYGPDIDGLVVVLRTQQQLWGTVPYRDDHLVAQEKRLQWLMGETREAEVTDLDDPGGGDENVGGLEVAVDDMRLVEVQEPVDELVGE